MALSEVLSHHVDRFLQHIVDHRRAAPNTVAAYRNDLRQFQQYLSQLPIDSTAHPQGLGLDGAAVAGFVFHLRERGYAEATVARKIAAVKSFFLCAAEMGLLSSNPAALVGSPRVHRSVPQAVDPADVQALLEVGCAGKMADDLRDRAMLTLVYHSGMRVSELVALNVDDVDLESASIRCRSRSGRMRPIPLAEAAGLVLQEYLAVGRPALAQRQGEEALFVNRRGTRLTRQGFWLIMKECARRAGISYPVTPHALRHSFALQHLGSGTTLRDLKELLGHVNLSTTQIYAVASRLMTK